MANAKVGSSRGESPKPATKEDLSEVLERLTALEGTVRAQATEDRLALIVFSGSLDRQIAAFVLATGAAASGMEVDMFFTFWGLSALRDPEKKAGKKDFVARAFGWVLPKGFGKLPLSIMNMGGLGRSLMQRVMKQKNFASIPDMLKICEELGVNLWACDMSREVLGIQPEELISYPRLGHCGVAHFLERASRSRVTMFL
jgi:peroxiredoxin family protein